MSFRHVMESSLTILAPHGRIDILSDYVEHFREYVLTSFRKIP